MLIFSLLIATFISTLANLDGEETFDASFLGHAEEVVQERISDDECILIKDTKVYSSSSMILRGANDYMLDEMERSIHNCLCAVNLKAVVLEPAMSKIKSIKAATEAAIALLCIEYVFWKD
jgi:chaperonin GroEL (HSP60 family)